MITKHELHSIHEQMMAERRDNGEPPTAKEMLAYTRGELSSEAAVRVQERLVAYPELVRTLTIPFPEPAEPGDEDYLSDAQFAEHWKAMQARMKPPVPIRRVESSPRLWRNVSLALAASLICVFGAFLWQMRSNIELRNDLGPSMPADAQMLYPDTRRGVSSSVDTIAAEGDATIVLPLVTASAFPAYRIELVDVSRRVLWNSGSVQPRADANGDERFTIVVPRAFLDPGQYQFVLYGGEARLTTYSFRLAR
jgi:hypothetical protein